ncbi:PPE domain-containing protein [Nocardia sp. FBN12]|uniref:PPE domain-containing protein n=1 Tax=Nocardia sp. FBN12 TaxID=3419766 RepID=UPI003CFC6A18
MALEPNTWSGLANQAKAGYLAFDPAKALAAAKACADLVDDLLGMSAAVTDLRLNNFSPIGNLTSGTQLSMALSNKGSRLHTILDDHAKIVTDMGDTYIAAGKMYTGTDHNSGDNIKALGELRMPTAATPYAPGSPAPGAPSATFDKPSGGFTWQNGNETHTVNADAESFPSSLKDYQGAKDTSVTASVENKDSLTFTDMHELGRDLEPRPVLAAAGTWHSLSTDLLSRMNNFVTVISAGTDGWEGEGAAAAAAAVTNYTDGVQPLINSMLAMSQNLDYTAQWLHLTKLSMPATSDAGDCCPGQVTRRYREEWQKHYGEGMKNTVSMMPVVNGPIATPQPAAGAGPNTPGGNENGGGQQGGSGSGTSGNGYGNQGNGYGNQGNGYGGQDGNYGDQGDGNRTPGDGYRSDRPELESSSGAGSGAGLPGAGTPTAGAAPDIGALPSGYEAAGADAPGGSAGGGGAPAGVLGGTAASQGATTPTRSTSGSGSSAFPRSSLPAAGQPESVTSGGMPEVSSLGSVPLPRGSSGAGGASSTKPSSSGGAGSGAGAGSLGDALGAAVGADPAQVKSVLDNLPGLLDEDTLSDLTGLPPEQVRSILDNIPDVVDENALAELSGVDPAGVRSVLENLPAALDEEALATATGGTNGLSSAGAGIASPDAASGAGSSQSSLASAGSDFLGQLGTALTQGLDSLTQLGSALPGTQEIQDMLRQFDPDALTAAAGLTPVETAGAGGSGAGGAGAGGAGAGGGIGSPETLAQQSSTALYPRAGLPGAESPVYPAVAAAARTDSTPGGMPMMPPAAAGGAGQNANGGHQPARFLRSRAHLDEAIGPTPDRVRPVADS